MSRACASLVALVAAAACSSASAVAPAKTAASHEAAEESAPGHRPGATERGKASYYSNRFAGRKTASGERYDPTALTAAHRKLPFGTVVEVTRSDGRRVTVRINDRGPFGKGRVIDLSRRAAEDLGMVKAGVVDVTLRVVSSPR